MGGGVAKSCLRCWGVAGRHKMDVNNLLRYTFTRENKWQEMSRVLRSLTPPQLCLLSWHWFEFFLSDPASVSAETCQEWPTPASYTRCSVPVGARARATPHPQSHISKSFRRESWKKQALKSRVCSLSLYTASTCTPATRRSSSAVLLPSPSPAQNQQVRWP